MKVGIAPIPTFENISFKNVTAIGAGALTALGFAASKAPAETVGDPLAIGTSLTETVDNIQTENVFETGRVSLSNLPSYMGRSAVAHEGTGGQTASSDSIKKVYGPGQEKVYQRVEKMAQLSTTEINVSPAGKHFKRTAFGVGKLAVDLKASKGSRTVIVFKKAKDFAGQVKYALATKTDQYFDQTKNELHLPTVYPFNPRKNGKYVVHLALKDISSFGVMVKLSPKK